MNEVAATPDQARVDALLRSAAQVRADQPEVESGTRSWRRFAITAVYSVALGGLALAAVHAAGDATPVRADGGADGALFSLTNQDRASNGVRSLNGNGSLAAIAEAGRYNGCGFPVNGRSADMIQRNYFAHPILGCGQVVFSMMSAYGVHYLSAGENIGWNTGGSTSAINVAFMNSSEHRSNILNPNYTDLGVGSATSGSSAWTGGGGSGSGRCGHCRTAASGALVSAGITMLMAGSSALVGLRRRRGPRAVCDGCDASVDEVALQH